MKKRLSLVLLSAVIAMSALFCALFAITSSAAEKEIAATFELGANGTASHYDGSSKTSYTETVDGVELSVTNGSSFYTGARDAKGNSCFKLGTSSKTGSFKFVVPDDVIEVIIYAAKYKANTSKITVNGTAYTLTQNSDAGLYDEIVVDTSTTKTVTFSTVSGGVRCMVNSIVFNKEAAESACEHEWDAGVVTTEATCITGGEKTYTCTLCGETDVKNTDALGHDYEVVEETDSDCETAGKIVKSCSRCDDTIEEAKPLADHDMVDGVCTACGKRVANAEFAFGANGSATHKDGSSDKATYSETVGGYALEITGGSKFYPTSYDAMGNSCIKLGSSSAAGKFTFTVPENIGKVVIYVAGYKANKANVTVNGVTHSITTFSNNGEYTAIEVDTTTNKTVDFTTVSGGYRAMMNTIEFYEKETAKITGASLNAGKDLTLKYKVFLPNSENIVDYRMVFTMNNKEYVVTTYTVEGDKYVFSFTGIAPQDIADLVSAYLYKEGSEEAVAEKLDYSVVEFAKDFVNKYGNDESYADYLTLLGNLLVYGQAAKNYTDYKVDEIIESVDGLTSTTDKAEDSASVRVLTQLVEGADATFAGVGVRFDYVNRIYVRYEVRDGAEATVKAMMGDTELELELIDGKLYTPALTATQFDETVTFTLSIDGVDVQTLTYSVNSYVVAKQESTNSEVANLAVALYNYGTAAEKIAQSAQ